MDLVILAGGLGSRFGGNKQTAGIDKNNNFIMDYSIYDAVKSGFNRVLIIISPKDKEIFEKTILSRIDKSIDVQLVFQERDIKEIVENNIVREKPLGTAHALVCAKDAIKDNFLIINADDFYGRSSFKKAYDFLNSINKNSYNFGNICYKCANTLSEKGAVKRGVCEVVNGNIKAIDECEVQRIDGKLVAKSIYNNNKFVVNDNQFVNMNLFCLTPKAIDYLQDEFKVFVSDKNNLQSKEFLLPTVLGKMANENIAKIKAISTDEVWFGMTYKEDKQLVIDKIQQLINNGVYPENLWNKEETLEL